MKNYKVFKYITYLVCSAFIISFILTGLIFVAIENKGVIYNFNDAFVKALLFDSLFSPLSIAGTILIYFGFFAIFLSFAISIWIATDIYAIKDDHWFILTSIFPLIGNIHALLRVFSENNLPITEAIKAEAIEEDVRMAIIEETNEIRAYKIDQMKALKLAEKNKVFVTVSKRRNKETKKQEKIWSCIDHRNKNKWIYKTKKEALKMSAKIANPKTIIIHNSIGKFEYWLKYIDDSNIPVIKTNKNTLAEFENGENQVLKILGVKAVAKKAPEIMPIVRKKIRENIVKEVSKVKNTKKIEQKSGKNIDRENNKRYRPGILAIQPETKVLTKVVKVVKTVVSLEDPKLKVAEIPITVKLTEKKKALLALKAKKENNPIKNKKIISQMKVIDKTKIQDKKTKTRKTLTKKKASIHKK